MNTKINKLKNFPIVNFITLDKSAERRAELYKQFIDCNIVNFVPHTFKKYEPGQFEIKGKLLDKTLDTFIGTGTSHLKAIKAWLESTDDEYGFFCEDDISLETVLYWNFTWDEFLNSLPKDWDCVQLGVLQEQLTEVNFRERYIYDWSILAYIIKREYAVKVINNHYKNNSFDFNVVGYDLPPSPEHIIYLNGGKVYSFPLFVENINFESANTPKNEHPETFDNHKKSYIHVVDWWKNIGKNLKIKDIIPSTKISQDIYTEFALDTENPEINFKIARHYHDLGQTASAFTYYFRCAERTDDQLLKYECFIRSYMCFTSQGKRDFTSLFLLKQAITIFPERPEAYYLISKHFEHKREWIECYTFATIAECFCNFNGPGLRAWTEYSGEYCILFQKAIAAWWLDKAEEAWNLFNDILDNYTTPETYKIVINNNLNNFFKDRKRKNTQFVKKYISHITKPETIKQEKNIIDCFPFYSKYGREMFELRYNVLKDHVDYFVISELNTTHTGKPIQWEAKKIIQELNIPQDKIIIIEIEVPKEDELPIQEIDKLNCMHGNDKNIDSVRSRCRERIQRDAIMEISDIFNSDTVFINSDLDEIINPKYVNWFADTTRQNKDKIIKVPLVYLQGKANLRTYYKNSDTPAPWNENLFLCTKAHFANTTPTKVRSCKLTTYPVVFVTMNNKPIEDAGWHFSWMGDANTKKIKQESFIHFTDKFNFVAGGGYNSDELNQIISQETEEGQTPPSGETDKVLKKYSINLLPKEIFELERVKKFLLPGVSSRERIHKETLDNILGGIYGFCSIKKATILIDLIQQYKPNVVVELGVLGGSSFIPQALAVKQNTQGVIYGIDPWDEKESLAHTISDEHINYWGKLNHNNVYEQFVNTVKKYEVENVTKIIRQTSKQAAHLFINKPIDLLHVDGNHSEEQSYDDVITYLPLVNQNGFILFDDIHWVDGGKNTTQKAAKHLQEHCNEIGTYTDEIGNCFTVFRKK